MGARPSPFGVDAERVPALVQGLIEAGVDWRGLHISPPPNASMRRR